MQHRLEAVTKGHKIVASFPRSLRRLFRVKMAQFAKSSFSYASYAAFRPDYSRSLYETVLTYHQGSREVCVDLGCGHGVVARCLAKSFSKVIGIDPSDGMIEQARLLSNDYTNLEFRKSFAENLQFLEKESVDLVVAGQAAHWFETAILFPELGRILRKCGTLAFWGYKDPVFVDFRQATIVLNDYAYGNDKFGTFWSQPGRTKVQNKLRDIEPPVDEWEEVQRIEYEPGNGPKTGTGTMFLSRLMALGEIMDFIRTWSAYDAWQDRFRQKKCGDGGEGDIVDEMFDTMRSVEPEWMNDEAWMEKKVEMEWGSGLLLAKRR